LGLIAEALVLKEHGVEMFALLEDHLHHQQQQPSSANLSSAFIDQLAEKGDGHILYLVHCWPETIASVISHIKTLQQHSSSSHNRHNNRHTFHFTLLLLPRSTSTATHMLEAAGLSADVNIKHLPCHWIPLEEDILSFEYGPSIFKQLSADKDPTCLWYIADAMMNLQYQYGTIPHVKGIGQWASDVARILSKMRREAGLDCPAPIDSGNGGIGVQSSSSSVGGIDTLILLDRSIDMISPMCGQLTYEGLLDEVFGLSCGQLRLGQHDHHQHGSEHSPPPTTTTSSTTAMSPKIHGLNSGDAVFRETRDLFYIGARKWMNETLRTIQQFRDTGIHAADFSQLKGFVSELKDKFTRIPLHTNLVEKLANVFQKRSFLARQKIEAELLNQIDDLGAIEDLVYGGGSGGEESMLHVLRLLCLYSTIHGGISKRQFDPLKRDLLNAYGHRHLLTLGALAHAGLLVKRESRRGTTAFGAAKSAFNLLTTDDGPTDGPITSGGTTEEPTDIHYAYAGYAPLSVRVVQQALTKGGWTAAGSALSLLSPNRFEILQTTDENGLPVEKKDLGSSSSGSGNIGRDTATGPGSHSNNSNVASPIDTGSKKKRKVVMVMFIGGVTYAEISALRFLSRKALVDCDFVVATTGMVNGSTLLAPFCVGK
jgi:vacuolar protein sorting-associated protein 33A